MDLGPGKRGFHKSSTEIVTGFGAFVTILQKQIG